MPLTSSSLAITHANGLSLNLQPARQKTHGVTNNRASPDDTKYSCSISWCGGSGVYLQQLHHSSSGHFKGFRVSCCDSSDIYPVFGSNIYAFYEYNEGDLSLSVCVIAPQDVTYVSSSALQKFLSLGSVVE